jgi:hypothetical protein
MMGRYAYSERRAPRRRNGCLQAFFALVFVGCLAVLIYAFALRPALTRAVADQIAGGPVPTLMPAGQAPGQAEAQVVEQAEGVLPDAVAALPAGELVISEDDVNGFLAARPEAVAPLDQVSLAFTPGAVQAEIAAYGVSSSATVGLAAQDGQVVVTSVSVEPPLAYVLSGSELAATLAERLNAELAAQGRRVEQLRVEQDQIVLVVT